MPCAAIASEIIINLGLQPPVSNTLYYLHGDHLGSTSKVTCGNTACGTVGAVVASQYYFPFGGVRHSSGTLPTDFGFTGQRRDAGVELMFYNARYLDTRTGRFLSADSIVPGAGNPQALNRYSYVLNAPTRYTDPTGHCIDGISTAFCVGALLVGALVVSAVVLLDAAKVPPITEPRDPAPTSSNMSSWTAERIRTNSQAPVTTSIAEHWASGNPVRMVGALKAWIAIVRTTAVWDYKQDIGEAELPGYPDIAFGGETTSFQAVANVHFGAVGRAAGFPAQLLAIGAGAFQILDALRSNQPSNIGPLWDGRRWTYFDDPYDNWWVTFGMWLYTKYGTTPNALTGAEFEAALLYYIDQNGGPGQPLTP
jgi:RHS repeat-associated protein